MMKIILNAKQQQDEEAQKQLENVYQWFKTEEGNKKEDFMDIRNSDDSAGVGKCKRRQNLINLQWDIFKNLKL